MNREQKLEKYVTQADWLYQIKNGIINPVKKAPKICPKCYSVDHKVLGYIGDELVYGCKDCEYRFFRLDSSPPCKYCDEPLRIVARYYGSLLFICEHCKLKETLITPYLRVSLRIRDAKKQITVSHPPMTAIKARTLLDEALDEDKEVYIKHFVHWQDPNVKIECPFPLDEEWAYTYTLKC